MSNIEWTEDTWNPIVGCSIKSPGCKSCYAMKDAWRKHHNPALPHYRDLTKLVNGKPVWTGILRKSPEHILLKPLSRRKPTMYFVNSMSDLFHEDIPDEWIDQVFAVMTCAGHHTFQVLTKRADRMQQYVSNLTRERIRQAAYAPIHRCVQFEGRWLFDLPLANVWLGVSAERQQEADERIPHLLNTPAAVRFVSAEPLIGPIDLTRICVLPQAPGSIRAGIHINTLAGRYCESGVVYKGDWDINKPPPPDSERRKLDWIIVGGESGSDPRPFDLDWARAILRQCEAAGVRAFMKQLGANPYSDGRPMHSVPRGKYGDPAEWPPELRVREFPTPRAI
jgi:protein gp37